MNTLIGRDVKVRFYNEAGQPVEEIAADSFSVDMTMETEIIDRLGSRESDIVPIGPRHYEGSVEFHLTSFAWSDFEQLMIDRQLNGEAIPRIDILVEERFNSGDYRIYLYPEAVFTPSTNYASGKESVKKSFKFQCKLRRQIAP